MALNLFSASATFLPHFGKNVIGKATGLDEYSAPAALTILFLFVSLVLVTLVLNENNCSPIGRFIHISVVFKTSLAMGNFVLFVKYVHIRFVLHICFPGGSDAGTSVKGLLKSRGVLLGLMLYLLNGFVTTWVGFVLPLIAYNHFHFILHKYGWLMVGVSATATISSLSMAQLSKSSCMANNRNGDWRALVISYTVMIIAIVISYLGGPSVSMLLKDFTVIVRFFCT